MLQQSFARNLKNTNNLKGHMHASSAATGLTSSLVWLCSFHRLRLRMFQPFVGGQSEMAP